MLNKHILKQTNKKTKKQTKINRVWNPNSSSTAALWATPLTTDVTGGWVLREQTPNGRCRADTSRGRFYNMLVQ